jgi:hypothetical protein
MEVGAVDALHDPLDVAVVEQDAVPDADPGERLGRPARDDGGPGDARYGGAAGW